MGLMTLLTRKTAQVRQIEKLEAQGDKVVNPLLKLLAKAGKITDGKEAIIWSSSLKIGLFLNCFCTYYVRTKRVESHKWAADGVFKDESWALVVGVMNNLLALGTMYDINALDIATRAANLTDSHPEAGIDVEKQLDNMFHHASIDMLMESPRYQHHTHEALDIFLGLAGNFAANSQHDHDLDLLLNVVKLLRGDLKKIFAPFQNNQ